LSNGGALWDEKRMISALDQPAALQAVRFVRDHIIGEISGRGMLAYEEPESLALFTQGRAIFHRNWPTLGRLPTILQVQKSPAGSACRRYPASRLGLVPLLSAAGNWALVAIRGIRTWPGASSNL
jgi:ABC-type glycerol-3-phosphate transport system substrate-binding protein